MHRVPKKVKIVFGLTMSNFDLVKFLPTLIIFGMKLSKRISLCVVHLLTTLPNLCQRTTVWNTDAPNCYITRRLFVSDGSPLHH